MANFGNYLFIETDKSLERISVFKSGFEVFYQDYYYEDNNINLDGNPFNLESQK